MINAQGTGRLTRDAELRYLPNGSAVCSFGIACSDGYTKDGKWVELPTTFVDAELFGRGAERVANLQKGTEVYVSGKVKSQQWTTQDGQKRSKVLISLGSIRALQRVEKQDVAVSQDDEAGELPF